MSPVQTLQVDVGHSRYPITIGSGMISNRDWLRAEVPAGDLMIVTNSTVAKLYLEGFTASLPDRRIAQCILPDGERHKTLQTVGCVLDALVANKLNRDAIVMALGGGVSLSDRRLRLGLPRRAARPRGAATLEPAE